MRIFSSVPPLLVQPRHLPTFPQRRAQLLCLLSLLFFGCLSTARAQLSAPLFDPSQIMKEIRHPHADLIQVCAHRGLYGAGSGTIPENSIPAIKAAVDARIELVELDIKITADDVPILMHDPGLKRTVYFSQRKQPAATALVIDAYWTNPWDPKHSLSQARLRANIPRNSVRPHLSKPSQYKVPSLEQALVYIRKNKLRAVFVLDLKDMGALRRCVQVVSRYNDGYGSPLLESFIFKIDGVQLSSYKAYQDAVKLTEHDFCYILRFNTTDVVNPNPQLEPTGIFHSHANGSNPYFLGIESVSKAPQPALTLANVISAARDPSTGGVANWNYYPLPELADKRYFWFGAGSPQGDGTYKSGDIINLDNRRFEDIKPSYHEDRDHREDKVPNDFSALDFLLDDGRATGLTYDDPVRLSAELKNRGLRNLDRYSPEQPRQISGPSAVADGAYTVANGASDQLLALNEASSRAGLGMMAGRPTPARPQQWQVTKIGAGAWFTLANRQTGQQLALVGTKLVLAAANDRDSTQLWTAAAATGGYVTLRSAISALTLATDATGTLVVRPLDSATDTAPPRAQFWRLTAVGAALGASAASPVVISPKLAAGTDLRLEIFPNPATSSFTVRCQSAQNQGGHLALRTLTGQLVAEQEASLQAGATDLRWDTNSLPAGAYVLFLTTSGQNLAKRVLITH